MVILCNACVFFLLLQGKQVQGEDVNLTDILDATARFTQIPYSVKTG